MCLEDKLSSPNMAVSKGPSLSEWMLSKRGSSAAFWIGARHGWEGACGRHLAFDKPSFPRRGLPLPTPSRYSSTGLPPLTGPAFVERTRTGESVSARHSFAPPMQRSPARWASELVVLTLTSRTFPQICPQMFSFLPGMEEPGNPALAGATPVRIPTSPTLNRLWIDR